MWVHSLICSLLFAFVVHFCYARDKKIEVAGIVECADCKGSNIKPSQVFSGKYMLFLMHARLDNIGYTYHNFLYFNSIRFSIQMTFVI